MVFYCPNAVMTEKLFRIMPCCMADKRQLPLATPEIKTMGKERKGMDFLKALFSKRALTFDEFVQAINDHNENEENKDKQIKLENINSGNYVSKLKYQELQDAIEGKETELTNANDLIAQMKESTEGNEDLQEKIANYETANAKLQAELAETKLKSEVKVQLLSAGVKDEKIMKFLTYELTEDLKEKGETLELDENNSIKGWNDKLEGLKTQYPDMFEKKTEGEEEMLNEQRLPPGDDRKVEPSSLAEALKMRDEGKE